MGLVDFVRDVIEEYKKRGVKSILLKEFVYEIAKVKDVRVQSVYTAIKELELRGLVKLSGNRKNKVLIIQ